MTSDTSQGGASPCHDAGPLADALRAAIKLLAVFCVVYFTAAMISTPELAHIAWLEILGLPLAFCAGILVFAAGLVVTRMCLDQDKG